MTNEERAALWEGEPPPFDEIWHRRMNDANKELIDDLRGRVTIRVCRLPRFHSEITRPE